MAITPFDQRIARVMVRPLAKTGITPNQITALTLVMALAAAWMFTLGDAVLANVAAGLFVLARFLDHFDGELARLTGKTSRFGYYFDYVTGGISYSTLFLGIGIGLAGGPLGNWAIVLGIAGAVAALLSMFLNLGLDAQLEFEDGDRVGYPSYGGFELEDGIYLVAPITWIGWMPQFFIAVGVGSAIYCLWTLSRLIVLRRAPAGHGTQPASGSAAAQAATEVSPHENGKPRCPDGGGQ
jgi:phosphatidylglycerophosphate synthase